MRRDNTFIKGLAIVGTLLTWLPVLAPLVMTRWSGLGSGHFNFDWLMPAELFPLVFVGGALLLTSSLLSHARRGLAAWGIGITVGMIVAGAVIAQVTGLASGAVEPVGLPWALAVGAIAGYVAGIVVLGVAGILMVRDLFTWRRRAEDEETPTVE